MMMNSVYLDSCIVIYLVERHAIFTANVEQQLDRLGQTTLAISPLVHLEVLVKPHRDVDKQLLLRYQCFLETLYLLPIPDEIYEIALSLRVQYQLKIPDALHLAIAEYHGCQEFWTNDERLKGVMTRPSCPDILIIGRSAYT
jgi:predicted nucleic acid-binding protein